MARSTWRRRVRLAITVFAITAALSSCSGGGGSTSSSSSATAAVLPELLGANGLYADPTTLAAAHSLSLYATAYASQVDSAILPTASVPTISPADALSLTQQLTGSGPIFGSYYLGLIGTWAHSQPLTQNAEGTLKFTASPDGYLTDVTGATANSLPIEISETAAALTVLRAEPAFRTGKYHRTLAWLEGIMSQTAGNPYLAWQAEFAASALGATSDTAAMNVARAWMRANVRRLAETSSINVADVYDAFGVAKIYRTGSAPLPTEWRSALTKCAQASALSADPQVLALGAQLAESIGTSRPNASILASISKLRLPDGLYANVTVINGSLGSTYELVTSPSFGSSRGFMDKLYASSLRFTRKSMADGDYSSCAVEQGLAVALNHLTIPADIANCARSYESQVAPETITQTTAQRWISVGPYLSASSMGRKFLSALRVTKWPGDSMISQIEAVRAAYVAYQNAPTVPSIIPKFAWTIDDAAKILALGPDASGPTYYLEAAYDLLSNNVPLTAASRTMLRQTLATDKGCPGLPTLYRVTLDLQSSCSLVTTSVAVEVTNYGSQAGTRK